MTDEGVAVCDNCGNIAHTPDELAVCTDSMLGPPRYRIVDGEWEIIE